MEGASAARTGRRLSRPHRISPRRNLPMAPLICQVSGPAAEKGDRDAPQAGRTGHDPAAQDETADGVAERRPGSVQLLSAGRAAAHHRRVSPGASCSIPRSTRSTSSCCRKGMPTHTGRSSWTDARIRSIQVTDVVRPFDRPLGRRHTRGRHDRSQRSLLVGWERHPAHRAAAYGGAVDANEPHDDAT